MKNNELHSKNLGYSFILSSRIQKILIKYFLKLFRAHLNEGREQIAVFAFDLIALEVNLRGLYEKEELEVFFEWALKTGLTKKFKKTTAIDIGANVGNHSLFFSKFFKHVISYEPNEPVFNLLKLNSALKKNIKIYNLGISNFNGFVNFDINNFNLGNSKIKKTKTQKNLDTRIKVCKLDSHIKQLKEISLIKIDVEGHEFEALSGASQVISANRPVILFEQHKKEFTVLDKFLNKSTQTIEFLKSLNYKKFAVIEYFPQQQEEVRKWYKPKILRLFSKIALMFRYSPTIKIVTKEYLAPKKYPLIIALP
jgi:FkbM family methyltransferase